MTPRSARRAVATGLACVLALVFAASAAAAPTVNGVFKVPGIETNNKIVAGPDGNMWVTVSNGEDDLARISPTGQVEEFELGELQNASGIALGPEGKLWVTATNAVASFSAADPKNTVTETTINAIAGVSPIVTGPDGNLWVATNEAVLRVSPAEPETITPFAVAGLTPKDIDVAGSLLVVADAGELDRIATFTTSGTEKDYPIEGGSQGVAGSSSGQLGFSQQIPKTGKPEQVGLITPPNPAQAFTQPDDPFGVALGSDQAYWIVRSAKDGLARLTSSGQLTLLEGLPKESMPRQIAAGPNNTLWVTLSQNEHEGVARISGLEPPVTITSPSPPPQTKIDKGPKKKVKTTGKRAKVKFRFTSTSAGATFQCALTKVKKVKKGKKAAKPNFKACKSPKIYSLKPGKYRFSVRAVSAGVVDPSPATRSFRVIHVRKR